MSGIPQNMELERGLLGCLLCEPAQTVTEFVATYPNGAKLFWDARHRAIFDALVEMVDTGKPVDSVLLMTHLDSKDELQEAGGIAYLTEVLGCATTAVNFPYYAEQLLDLHVDRELLNAGEKLKNLAGKRLGRASLDEAEKTVMGISLEHTLNDSLSVKDLVKGALVRMQDRWEGKEPEGLKTGLRDLDRLLVGLKPGGCYVVAARPSKGKTSLAMQIVENVSVINGIPSGVFSLEMSREELIDRMICTMSQVCASSLSHHAATEQQFSAIRRAAKAISSAPMEICDQGGLTISALRAKARRMAQRHHIQLLVVDYIQLMQGHSTRENRNQEVSEVSRGLKSLAKELRLPVIVVSQLNRQSENENRMPRLSDLRESGSIEQDADVVVMIHERTPRNERGISEVDLLVLKQRSGPTGTVPVLFATDITRFKDRGYED
jgi:replicative DNA helicase